MRIDLKGWSSKCLRCPDLDVDLSKNGQIPPVSLVQMPNGTGKTTTLDLLRAALNGEAQNWSSEKVREFSRPKDDASRGQFNVDLLVDGQPLSFELTLNYQEGHARYRTTTPGSGGVAPGWTPPPTVHRFLSEQFISLFVFDGEFAHRLLDSRKSEAEKAIDALCQLYLLEDISEIVEQAWNAATRRGGPKTEMGLTQYRNLEKSIKQRINDVEKAKEKAENELRGLDEEIADLTESISKHMANSEDIREQYEKAQGALENANIKVTNISSEVMQVMRSPWALHDQFGTALKSLKGQLDRLKLPENTSAQFFKELIEEADYCICGRPMDEEAQRKIKLRSKDYLGAEEAGIINAIKGDIDQFSIDHDDDSGTSRLQKELQSLSGAVREQKHASDSLRRLKQQLINAGDEQLKTWQNKLAEKSKEYEELNKLRITIISAGDETEDSDETFSLSLLQKRLADVEGKISQITGTLKLRHQTQLIKEIMDEAGGIARNKIRDDLTSECNERLKTVLSGNPLEIDRIEHSLHLRNQSGASVGETLSVGYTFLMSALNRGKNQFPLIVDSPANPLDAPRRREIGRLIPELCTQFVGFTISTERFGFVDALEEKCNEINYLTIFRRTAGTKKLLEDLPSSGVKKTPTAVLVEGREYFTRFDLEEEPE